LTGASLEGARAAMRPMPGGVEMGRAKTVSLEPNGMHIIFTGRTSSFEADTYFEGTLTFRSAGTVRVKFFVEAGPGNPHVLPTIAPKAGHEHHH
jgi:copper(I)-binding protein